MRWPQACASRANITNGPCNDAVLRGDGPVDVRGAYRGPPLWLSGGVLAVGGRPGLRLPGDRSQPFRLRPAAGPAGARVRDCRQPVAAVDPVLHLHGRDPGTVRP